MKGSDIAILLIVLGVGGLAIWFLTRPKDVAEGKVPSKGLCEAGVELGAGAASKGQVNVGQQSTAICDFLENAEVKVATTLSGAYADTFGREHARPCEPNWTSRPPEQCKGWQEGMCKPRAENGLPPLAYDSKGECSPIAPAGAIVQPTVRTAAQRSQLLSAALGTTPTRKL